MVIYVALQSIPVDLCRHANFFLDVRLRLSASTPQNRDRQTEAKKTA